MEPYFVPGTLCYLSLVIGYLVSFKVQSTAYGVTPTTGLNFTDAPSRFVRKRIRGAVEEAEFDA